MKYKSMTVVKTSIFPAPKKEVFRLLQKFSLLSKIVYPYIIFMPENGNKNLVWNVDRTFVFKAKLLGIIPFGTHTINVKEFDEDNIYTNEVNTYVPVWNHRIVLEEFEKGKTLYSDIVEINAGWRTPFVYAWAKCFYAHRQRKWIRILKYLKDRK